MRIISATFPQCNVHAAKQCQQWRI